MGGNKMRKLIGLLILSTSITAQSHSFMDNFGYCGSIYSLVTEENASIVIANGQVFVKELGYHLDTAPDHGFFSVDGPSTLVAYAWPGTYIKLTKKTPEILIIDVEVFDAVTQTTTESSVRCVGEPKSY